jgi:Transglycosylase SLT domain/SPOR domain
MVMHALTLTTRTLAMLGALQWRLDPSVVPPTAAFELRVEDARRIVQMQNPDHQSAPPRPPADHPNRAGSASSFDSICETLESAARANELPLEFFTRLIWQESRFDPQAVSRAGAQGVAQFMPSTAVLRGLANPFDPIEAIVKSAELLRDLRKDFGNLGLAAAAYNAGAKRVQEWLAGRRNLPQETQDYVLIITGHSANEWRRAEPRLEAAVPQGVPCPELDKLISASRSRSRPVAANVHETAKLEWGVQLVGNSSEASALADFRSLQKKYPSILAMQEHLTIKTKTGSAGSWYRIRVGVTSRQSAEKLCSTLRAAGGTCLVQRN